MGAETLLAQRPTAEPSPNKIWLRALERTAGLKPESLRTLAVAVEEGAERNGAAQAILSDHGCFSYAQLAVRARRYSRWALAQGWRPGTVVALLAPNRPEYLATWLGLTRVGVVVALINPSLAAEALAHSLRTAEAEALIVSTAFEALATSAITRLAKPLSLHVQGAPAFDAALAASPGDPLRPDETPPVTLADPALLIYTSGTTGLPKAARVSHHRIMSWSGWFAGLMGAGESDRLYDCLPLCHSVGGVAAPGAMLVSGGAVVVREKFSARAFWDDIARWDCTLFQYIGELCRYLSNAPAHPLERSHRLRMVCGNGLSAEVWTAFQDRFAIPKVLEFYAATEGNVSLYNVEGRPGAIGRVPAFLSHRFPLALARFDVETGAPARGADGLCIRCAVGEAGEALGRIDAARGASGRFEGYTAAADTDKKVLRDVFEPGDAWFRTGDLMRADAQGFYYFVDRIGDTFRWKGENVATTEVAAVISTVPGVLEVAVYGVPVPGADGRAGMAALVTGPGFDLAVLRRTLHARLPAYARPLVVRLLPTMAMTDTFKQKKAALAAEGFDPAIVTDPLYQDAPEGYRRLDAQTPFRLFAR